MADDPYLPGLPGRTVSPAAPTRAVGDRQSAVSEISPAGGGKQQKDPTLQLDSFSLQFVTPEIAAKLLETSLMGLSDSDIALSRIGMLKLALEKICANMPLEKADEEALFLASAILRSAPRMITSSLPHDVAEYKQEEIRALVDEFIAIASSWGVVIYKQIISA